MTTQFRIDIEENLSSEVAEKIMNEMEDIIGKNDYTLEYSDFESEDDEEEE